MKKSKFFAQNFVSIVKSAKMANKVAKLKKFQSLFSLLTLIFAVSFSLSACDLYSKKEGLALISVSSSSDTAPELKFPDKQIKIPVKMAADGTTPLNVVYPAIEGSGETVEDGQTVEIGYLMISMPSKEVIYSTWTDTDSPNQPYEMVKNESDPNDIYPHLLGKKVGSVILEAIPGQNPASLNDANSTDLKYDLDGINYSVRALKILSTKTVPTSANGAPVSNIDPSLPKVTLASNGAPSISIPENYPLPTTAVLQKLKTGTGSAVTEKSNVTVQYSGWLQNGTKFESTWDMGHSTSIAYSDMLSGWKNALKGATVGSQFLLILPPNDAYGDSEMSSIPANSTVFFVIDILDVR